MAKETYDIAKEETEKSDLVSLKRTKAEIKARQEPSEVTSPSYDEYPYNTRLDLDDDIVSKLGLKELPSVGDEMTLVAKVEVVRTSESEENGEKTRRSVCLQITRMKLS